MYAGIEGAAAPVQLTVRRLYLSEQGAHQLARRVSFTSAPNLVACATATVRGGLGRGLHNVHYEDADYGVDNEAASHRVEFVVPGDIFEPRLC
jgi:hypothetical protein